MPSLFIEFLGDTPAIRILDFLIEHKGRDFSKTEIAAGASIARATLFKHWSAIETHGIVRVTRRFGKTRLYTLNATSPIIRKALELEQALIAQAMERHAGKSRAQFKSVAVRNP